MFRDLPPSQIVPRLADAGVYAASESSFYRILKGAAMLATLQWLGIVPSFSRPRVAFDNLEATRQWVSRFVGWCNKEHQHGAIRFVTPSGRHSGEERKVLRRRQEVYEEVRERNPSRRTGSGRAWTPIGEVILNPVAHGSNRLNEEWKSA